MQDKNRSVAQGSVKQRPEAAHQSTRAGDTGRRETEVLRERNNFQEYISKLLDPYNHVDISLCLGAPEADDNYSVFVCVHAYRSISIPYYCILIR